MNQDDLNIILLKFHELSRKQLEEVRRVGAWHLQQRLGKESVQEQDWILSGIFDELESRGLNKEIPYRFKPDAQFQTKSIMVRDLLNEAISNMSVIEQKTLGIICAQCLAEYISSWSEGTVSFDSMIHNISRIPDAIERSFPAYISCGMLGAILRKNLLRGN